MKSRNVVCLTIIIMLMAAFSAFGENIWQADEELDEARWYGSTDYWSQGRFPEGDDDPRFDSPVPCILDDEVTIEGRMRFRWDPSTLIIADGGRYIQTGGARNIMDNSQGTIIIEEGGYMELSNVLTIGSNGEGIDGSSLIMNGGELWLADGTFFDVGRGGEDVTCSAYLNEGTLSIWRLVEDASSGLFSGDSYMDISFGEFIYRQGDYTDRIQRLIDADGLRAFGGTGTLVVEVNDEGQTVVTAVSPMEPSPTYRGLVRAGDVDLQWTNLEDSETVDVWFGDARDNLTQVVTGEEVSSVQVNAPVVTEPTTYYWRVDTYIDDELIEGAVFRFDVTENLPPEISITTPRMISWAGEPIQLETEVVHDDPESLTYSWEATTLDGDPLDEPAVFEPGDDVADPTITVDYHAGIFMVTVTVEDGINEPVTASRLLDVAEDPCQAAIAIGIGDDYPADIAGNCIQDLEDYAEIASEWLADFNLTEPVPVPEEEEE